MLPSMLLFSNIVPLAMSALTLNFGQVQAGFNAASQQNVAVYWGQNSRGQGTGPNAQQRLAYYCAISSMDIIPMAFVTVISDATGHPQLNFANAGDNCTVFPGTSTFNCPQLAEDIVTCQQTYGKTILLSVGGATYSEGGFPSAAAATTAAQMMWATFGPVQSGSSALRPFGSAVIDGFDFDFESGVSNMATFANELRSLMDASGGKKYLLTAAPQCVYPDYADNEMLSGSTYFDAIWIQFYNNYCGVSSFVPGAATQNNFNFDTWDNWAKTVSKNPNVKILVGIPASSTAGGGYVAPSGLAPIISYVKQFSSFGGIMMWDASQALANTGFLDSVSASLASSAKREMRWGTRMT